MFGWKPPPEQQKNVCVCVMLSNTRSTAKEREQRKKKTMKQIKQTNNE